MSARLSTLFDPEVQRCPFAFYAKLRAETPVSFMPALGAYYIANYELGRKVLIDARRFAKKTLENDGRRFIEPNPKAQALLREKDIGLPMSLMAQKEGAEHRAYRSIVDHQFQSGTVRKLGDHVIATATGLLDAIAGGEIEAMSSFAVPLPLYVISDILGIPKSEYRTFKRWSDGLVTYVAMVVSDAEAIAGAEAMVEMHRYMIDQVAERRIAPREDLLTVLARARHEGRPLTDHEICAFTDELLVAGNETTTSAIGSGLLDIASNQELQASLRAKPVLIPKFVEEILRTASPIQLALRFALEDVTIGGVDIPAMSKVFVGLASANRDDSAFAAAAAIDPERVGKTHLSFGAGEHHCLGAELARLELRTAFALWLDRFVTIELAQPADTVAYPMSYTIRGPLSLMLRVTRR